MKLYISSPPDFEVLDASKKKNDWNHIQLQVISSGARPGLNCEKQNWIYKFPPTGRQDQWPWVDKKERPDFPLALRTPDLLQGRTVLNDQSPFKITNNITTSSKPNNRQVIKLQVHRLT